MVSLFPPHCPQLPDFQSLLVRGSYHSSAPIHLLLSHGLKHPEDKAVLLTPHRESFRNAITELNDQWLELHGGNGRCSGAAQRTQIFYPPTLAHLRLTLSTLHEYDDTLHHRKTTLEAAPTLLVLHEPSAYFSADTTQATVSAYLSIVSSALTLTSSWSPKSSTVSKLVIFDSGLDQLQLPILPALSFDDPHDSEHHRGTLSVLLERYIEWKVEFLEDAGSDPDDMQEDETANVSITRKSLRLLRIADARPGDDREEGVVWTWTETVHTEEDGRRKTSFLWMDDN